MTVSQTPDGNGGGGDGTENNGNGNGSGGSGRRVLAAKTENSSTNNNNLVNINNNFAIFSMGPLTDKRALTVRRVLFGPPADPEETRAWLDGQLRSAATADTKSWNFDFANERPMRDSPADRYAWERVSPPRRGSKQQQKRKRRGAADADDSADDADSHKRRPVRRQSKVTGEYYSTVISSVTVVPRLPRLVRQRSSARGWKPSGVRAPSLPSGTRRVHVIWV